MPQLLKLRHFLMAWCRLCVLVADSTTNQLLCTTGSFLDTPDFVRGSATNINGSKPNQRNCPNVDPATLTSPLLRPRRSFDTKCPKSAVTTAIGKAGHGFWCSSNYGYTRECGYVPPSTPEMASLSLAIPAAHREVDGWIPCRDDPGTWVSEMRSFTCYIYIDMLYIRYTGI